MTAEIFWKDRSSGVSFEAAGIKAAMARIKDIYGTIDTKMVRVMVHIKLGGGHRYGTENCATIIMNQSATLIFIVDTLKIMLRNW